MHQNRHNETPQKICGEALIIYHSVLRWYKLRFLAYP